MYTRQGRLKKKPKVSGHVRMSECGRNWPVTEKGGAELSAGEKQSCGQTLRLQPVQEENRRQSAPQDTPLYKRVVIRQMA